MRSFFVWWKQKLLVTTDCWLVEYFKKQHNFKTFLTSPAAHRLCKLDGFLNMKAYRNYFSYIQRKFGVWYFVIRCNNATLLLQLKYVFAKSFISLTLVLRFELPVARSSPRGHGPGAEVWILPGLRGQLQAHGGDVSLSNGNHIPVWHHKSIQTKN